MVKEQVIVQISQHHNGKHYNLNLFRWQGKQGIAFPISFKVTRKRALKEAEEYANLYKGKIIEKDYVSLIPYRSEVSRWVII